MDADPKDTEGQLYQVEGYLISRFTLTTLQ